MINHVNDNSFANKEYHAIVLSKRGDIAAHVGLSLSYDHELH